MTIGTNTAYEIIVYLAGASTNDMVDLVYHILAGIATIVFFIGVLYLMKVILISIARLGET